MPQDPQTSMQRRNLAMVIASLGSWPVLAQAPQAAPAASSTPPKPKPSLLAPAKPVPMARVGALQGTVQVMRAGELVTLRVGTALREGDEVRAMAGSEAFIQFRDGAKLAVRPDSQLQLEALQLGGPVSLRTLTIRMLKGGLRYISGKATVRNNVRFTTATATIGIRGTDIEIVLNEEATEALSVGTVLKVNAGAAVLAAPDGTQVDVAAGEQALGAEADLIPRGSGRVKRPQARTVDAAIQAAASVLFKGGALDKLMR